MQSVYATCVSSHLSGLDWQAIWLAAEDVRLLRGWTKRDLFARAGISHTAYRDMQLGEPLRRADKIHSFVTALGWTMDDLENVGRGGEPPVVAPDEGPAEVNELQQQISALQDLVLTLHRTVREHTQTIRELHQIVRSQQDEGPGPGTPKS